MKVLHLFSNSKWTGPAEPALNLCVALRALGVEADFACAPGSPRFPNRIVETARARGIEPLLQFRLDKHHHPLWNWRDARALAQLLERTPYDLLHCHLDNDHRIAVAANRRHRLPLVRTSYGGTGLEGRWMGRLLPHTRLLIEPSEMALAHDARKYGIPSDRLCVIPGAVDTARFDPGRSLPDGRARLHLKSDALLVGIVARMQTHRHYEDLFLAFRELREMRPKAHLVVIGRGTKQETVALAPVKRLGLEDCVHFTGYLDGDDYVGMLRALDIGVFLVPGSDGTCRAARELLAMGCPMVVADRGMLREMVRHAHDGLVCDGSPEQLRAQLLTLAASKKLRQTFGQHARAGALSLEAQARQVLARYEQILELEKHGK